MKLGLGLPNYLPDRLDRQLVLAWARTADQAGFATLATADRPQQDVWEPLTTLAAVAAVTEQVRLATTILILPPRDAVLVAKQAAVIDRLSGGRLDLGVALGTRPEDYAAFGDSFTHRVTRLRQQLAIMRQVWEAARTVRDHPVPGPAPLQQPLPVLLGGIVPAARRRAVELGDGYIFGALRPGELRPVVEELRAWARELGKPHFTIAGFVAIAVGGERERAEAVRQITRYYTTGTGWSVPLAPEEMVFCGPPAAIGERAAGYAAAGFDQLILAPWVPELQQVELLAEHVLPAYR